MHSVWKLYLAAAAAVTSCYLLLPAGAPQLLAYTALSVSCVVAISVGVLVHRPARPAAWWLQAVGLLAFACGDVVVNAARVSGVPVLPVPSDALYLSSYPVLLAGLLLLVLARRRGRDLAGLVDSAVVVVAAGLVVWVVVAGPVLRDSDLGWVARAVAVSYPAADILLLALLVRLVVLPGERTTSFWLLVGGVLLLFVADVAYAIITAVSDYRPGPFSLLWMGSYALWGAAALHPSMRRSSEPGARRPAVLSWRRLTALVVAVMLAPATSAVELLLGRPVDQVPVIVVSVIMFALVVARMQAALRASAVAAGARDRLQVDLLHQASHDVLTGLANRAASLALIAAALHRAQRSGDVVALLFIDLDRFKAVNDAHGHRAGDEVLVRSAQRMVSGVRGGDVVGRLGGDEFVVLLEPAGSQTDAVRTAERIAERLAGPVDVVGDDGRRATVSVGASIGVALALDGATSPEVLLHEADTAAYRAKAAGGSSVEVFDEGLRAELAERAAMEAAIREGLARGEFLLHYQPLLSLEDGTVRGVEALARWQRPDGTSVSPGVFVPVAEASDLVCDLGRWVLGEATRQYASWRREGRTIAGISVNLSARHLAGPGVVDEVRSALTGAGMPAHALVVEVTETVLVDDSAVITTLEGLRALGVRVAIDDFGTGYTSISRLVQLPADVLKVDRSLVAATGPAAAELLRLVVGTGRALGLSVVAEGVETREQAEAVLAAGCTRVQGYWVSRPTSADRVPLDAAALADEPGSWAASLAGRAVRSGGAAR